MERKKELTLIQQLNVFAGMAQAFLCGAFVEWKYQNYLHKLPKDHKDCFKRTFDSDTRWRNIYNGKYSHLSVFDIYEIYLQQMNKYAENPTNCLFVTANCLVIKELVDQEIKKRK